MWEAIEPVLIYVPLCLKLNPMAMFITLVRDMVEWIVKLRMFPHLPILPHPRHPLSSIFSLPVSEFLRVMQCD